MTAIDIDHLRQWIGRTRETVDVVTPRLAANLAAILGEDGAVEDGAPAPVGIHWCLSPDIAPMAALGPDGHPARGGFLPPVPFPRRMWAGGALTFSGDFRVGDVVARRSRIDDVTLKQGGTGPLCFVTVTHDYTTPRGLALSERQDIVYRELEAKPSVAPSSAAPPLQSPPPPPGEPERTQALEATPVLLFRYSAITFNGHRIHYDRSYCREEENYPGLVVHGPLQATCLLRMAIDMGGGTPDRFSFRGLRPLFDGQTCTINGRRADGTTELWVADAAGHVTMKASAGKASAGNASATKAGAA